jgi:hypothetical protein
MVAPGDNHERKERPMDRHIWAIAAALGIALGILSAPAGAAPALGGGAGGVKAAVAGTGLVEQARWYRRCWHDRWGYRHCRRVWGDGPYYGPGIGFYFGGWGHHHHGYRGHGHRGYGYRGHGHGHGGHHR